MKTVKFHRYTKDEGANILSEPGGVVLGTLPKGTWLGVTDHSSTGWYFVITAQYDGWVEIDETTPGQNFSLCAIKPEVADFNVYNYALSA